MPFTYFFDSTIIVDNRAKNGRSTKSFIAEGLWQPILDNLREGDYVLVQFGHNDEGKEKVGRYTTPDEFKANLVRYITETRAKKAIPVLITPVARRQFDSSGHIRESHPVYADAVREVAAQQQVPLIDLDEKSKALLQQFGPENSKWLYNYTKPGEHPNGQLVMLHSADRPEVQRVVAGLRGVVDEYEDRVLIGEIYLPVERLVAYYGADLRGAHLPFNFQLLETRWDARGIAALINEYEAALPRGGWPNWVLGNHDKSRVATRIGVDQARVAAILLLTLRGTPTMYYGDELGMPDVKIPPDRIQDPFEKNVPGQGLGRDPCRTPMQWNGSTNAGFTSGTPWLPVDDDYPIVNVESQSADPSSILTLYHRLIALRRQHAALAYGDYEPVAMTGDLLAYIRKLGTQRFCPKRSSPIRSGPPWQKPIASRCSPTPTQSTSPTWSRLSASSSTSRSASTPTSSV